MAVCSSLVGNIEVLEDGDGDGEDLCRWGVFFCIGSELSAQAKVEISQLVGPGVTGPHSCKYFPGGTKVLFHEPLLDGYSLGYQKSGAHMPGKDLEERDRIPDALEVVWDLQTFAELATLAPGGGLFLGDCG